MGKEPLFSVRKTFVSALCVSMYFQNGDSLHEILQRLLLHFNICGTKHVKTQVPVRLPI